MGSRLLYDVRQGLGTVMREWIDNGTYAPLTTASCTRDELAAAARRYAAEKAAKPLTIITAIAEVISASKKVKQMQEALQAAAAGPETADAATTLPAATDAATTLPAPTNASTVLPAAIDAAIVSRAATDAATVVPAATDAATDLLTATDVTTVLPAATDAGTVSPATAIDAIALPQITAPVIGSIISAQSVTGSEGVAAKSVQGGSLHEQATIATAVASLELASAQAADQAAATNTSIAETESLLVTDAEILAGSVDDQAAAAA